MFLSPLLCVHVYAKTYVCIYTHILSAVQNDGIFGFIHNKTEQTVTLIESLKLTLKHVNRKAPWLSELCWTGLRQHSLSKTGQRDVLTRDATFPAVFWQSNLFPNMKLKPEHWMNDKEQCCRLSV